MTAKGLGTTMLLLVLENASNGSALAETSVSYTRDIKPILDAKCVECHHYSSRYVDLSRFPFVSAWTTDQALLVDALLGRVTPPSVTMPPGGRPELEGSERALIREWLEQGLQP